MKSYLCVTVAMLFLFACNREKQPDSLCFDGIVRYAGNPAADGLGWVIYKDDSTATARPFVPRNLADEFKVNELKVKLCLYETNEKASCFCPTPPNKYYITDIKSR